MARIKKQQSTLTSLSMSAVYPDGWNKMRVTYAKAIFSRKTISEGVGHYAELLGCKKEILDIQLSPLELSLGVCLRTKRATILAKKAQTLRDVSMSVKSGIADLLFRAYGGALYNGLFMKKDMKFDRSNIDYQERRINYILKFFTSWYECRDVRKLDSDPCVRQNWEKSVLSDITYNVMMSSVMGFYGYSQYMLNNYPNVSFVPALHSNTSSLESHFSLM